MRRSFLFFFIFWISYVRLIWGPLPTKSIGAYVKFKRYLWRFTRWKKRWYAYVRWSIIYVGCWAQLSICHFGSCLIKKINFGTPKMEKNTFHRTKQKSASMVFHAIPRVTCLSDIASFRQTMPWSGPNLARLT
jgi:hypothetical protein